MSYSHNPQTERKRLQPLPSIHSLSHLRNDDYGTTFPSTRTKIRSWQSLERSILSADVPGCGLLMKKKGWTDMDGSYEFSFFPLVFDSGSKLLHTGHPEIGPVAYTSL